MKRLLVAAAALVALVGALPVHAATDATPTATLAALTPNASPAATPALKADRFLSGKDGGDSYEHEERFLGGAVIGHPSTGATKLGQVTIGDCTFDLPAIAAVATPVTGVPTTVRIACTQLGAAVGDLVLAVLDNHVSGGTNYDALRLQRCAVFTAGRIDCMLAYIGPALDAGVLHVRYVLMR